MIDIDDKKNDIPQESPVRKDGVEVVKFGNMIILRNCGDLMADIAFLEKQVKLGNIEAAPVGYCTNSRSAKSSGL